MAQTSRLVVPALAALLSLWISLGSGLVSPQGWLGIQSSVFPDGKYQVLQGTHTRVVYPDDMFRHAVLIRATLENLIQSAQDAGNSGTSSALPGMSAPRENPALEVHVFPAPRALTDSRWGLIFAPRPGGLEASSNGRMLYVAAFGGDDGNGYRLSSRIEAWYTSGSRFSPGF